ncbi:MAG: histidine kinase dimerization/phospho-acceptor domain-containing protein, partial [Solirubrobacterales bacterium]
MLLLAVVALGIPLALSLRDRVDAEVRDQARSEANVVASAVATLGARERHTLDRLTRVAARSVRGRVLIVGPSGRVIADSAGPHEVGSNYATRPEVKAALAGQDYQQTRDSQTLGTPILATAVPVSTGGHTVGAVRITQSVSAVTSAVRTAILGLVILGAVVLLLALVAGALIAQQIARPIRRLDRVARRVAGGELEAQAPLEGSSEQRSLAISFNDMTARMRRLLHSQQDFVADASHQLRTPLTGLRLQLEELRETAAPGDPSVPRLDAGLAEVDRLSEMVDELLILSRAGEHEQPAESIDLARSVDALMERWGNAAADAGIRLARRAEGDGET